MSLKLNLLRNIFRFYTSDYLELAIVLRSKILEEEDYFSSVYYLPNGLKHEGPDFFHLLVFFDEAGVVTSVRKFSSAYLAAGVDWEDVRLYLCDELDWPAGKAPPLVLDPATYGDTWLLSNSRRKCQQAQ